MRAESNLVIDLDHAGGRVLVKNTSTEEFWATMRRSREQGNKAKAVGYVRDELNVDIRQAKALVEDYMEYVFFFAGTDAYTMVPDVG